MSSRKVEGDFAAVDVMGTSTAQAQYGPTYRVGPVLIPIAPLVKGALLLFFTYLLIRIADSIWARLTKNMKDQSLEGIFESLFHRSSTDVAAGLGTGKQLRTRLNVVQGPLQKLSYRRRMTIFLILLLVVTAFPLLARVPGAWSWFRRHPLQVLSALGALFVAAQLLVSSIRNSAIVIDVEPMDVNAVRNAVDANFMESSDTYVRGHVRVGCVDTSVTCANLGLANRAAAAVSTVDVQSLAMIIAKDKTSGSEILRVATFDDTLTLATAILMKRTRATSKAQAAAESQLVSTWDLMGYLKRHGLTALPIVIFAAFAPWSLVPTVILHSILFPKDSILKPLNISRKVSQASRRALDLVSRCVADWKQKEPAQGRIRGKPRSEAEPRRLFRCGPLLRVPHFFASGMPELRRSFVYRSARRPPPLQDEALEAFKQALPEAMAYAFPEGIDVSTPLDMVKVIKDCHYDARKERSYLDAISDMGLIEDRYMVARRAKAFIKLETYPNYTKEPRTIQCQSVPNRVIAHYYLTNINESFFRNQQVSVKHVPAPQRPAVLSNLFGDLTTVVSWDQSGFEASVSLPLERALWQFLVDEYCVPQIVADMICFDLTEIANDGLSYTGPHSRRSGDYWTSLSNSLVNLTIQFAVARMNNNVVSHVVVEGDDCLISYRDPVQPYDYIESFRELGFEAKMPEVGTGPGSVAFCSTKFGPDLEPTRDPRNIVDNIGVSSHARAGKDPAYAMGLRALSYSCDCPTQPITWVLANIAADEEVDPADLPWWYRLRARSCDEPLGPRRMSPPTLQQREQYADLWDCPVAIQELIEDCLVKGIDFYRVPAIRDWRDADRPDWQAVVDAGDPYVTPEMDPHPPFSYSRLGRRLRKRIKLALRTAGLRIRNWRPTLFRNVPPSD